MDKRYQVFVSSTYADLKDERKRVIQALMEMDCIPAGMELFPAQDEEQLTFIKRIIDDCDYYLIIIGGRYGSLTSDGVSYTEKEFDYAIERGIKVVAFLHEEPANIAVNKSDVDPALRQKLSVFREKVATGRLVRHWKLAEELPGLVALSLSKTIKTYPAIGWVRASFVASNDLLVEINELRKSNSALQIKLEELQSAIVPQFDDIADLDSTFKVCGDFGFRVTQGYKSAHWELSVSWREIFGSLAPYLMTRPSEHVVKLMLTEEFGKRAIQRPSTSKSMDDQCFRTIGLQFKALRLVKIELLATTEGGWALFWSLTEVGERMMMNVRVVRKEKE